MRAAVVVLALLDVNGFLALRGVNATGPESWLDEGWGRLMAGGDRNEAIAVANAGVDWTSKHFGVHVSGVARHDVANDHAGIVEAYADARAEFGLDELQLRAGQFFLPTSRENKDANWSSPYSVTFSALNSWIGEEVRPLGVDLQYRHITSAGHAITTGATAFRGNDTMGSLLAWRGWALGDRLSTYNEVLPLPAVDALFAAQRDGTLAIGDDLDGKTGYSARVRYSVPQRGNLQYAYVDNQGDRLLYEDEYAWATSFHLVSAELGNPDDLVFAAEYMRGRTGMGLCQPGCVDARFYAAYALVSEKRGRNRWTARYEMFNTEDRDFLPSDVNEESGRSWTLAWLYELRANVRLAAEFTQVTGMRETKPDPDARSFLLEARYRF